jgi:hypothetical protein
MTRYLISFDDGDMVIPEADLPEVAAAAHAASAEAKQAGVWVFGGGLHSAELVSSVAVDGTVTDRAFVPGRAYPGGLTIVDVPTRDEALEWAARFAAACRCAQSVREFGADPVVDDWLARD